MDAHIEQLIRQLTGADTVEPSGTLQALWSGYGSIDRYTLSGADRRSVVVKHVRFPDLASHPRGWNTQRSDQRKRHSYQVETHWYQHWAKLCGDACRVPHCLAVEEHDDDVLLIMEDLVDSGYALTPDNADMDRADLETMDRCLHWLADFHATFMGRAPDGLWPTGTYWHLATRPDELEAMEDGSLKAAAHALDKALNRAPFQTFVHGDAKLANFCFSADRQQVAAVDFQYVGGGCGMKDVAYFIGSCLNESACERHEERLLERYFQALRGALARHQPEMNADTVETAWRPLYAVAWTDFHRFLKGWSPGHWKIHSYSERLADQVIRELSG